MLREPAREYPEPHRFGRDVMGNAAFGQQSLQYRPAHTLPGVEQIDVGGKRIVALEPLNGVVASVMNDIYQAELNSGETVILKLGNPNWKGVKTECEVSTLKFLRENTDIPVPEVLTFSADAKSSPIGREFIVLEKAAGKPLHLEQKAYREDPKQWGELLGELAGVVAQMREISFPEVGSFRAGRDSDLELRGRTDLGTKRDPHESFAEFAKDAVNFYEKTLRREVLGGHPQAKLLLEALIELSRLDPHVYDQWETEGEQFVFSHQDFVMKNILVEDGKVTAVLDWEWAGAATQETEHLSGLDFLSDRSDRVVFEKALQSRGVCDFFETPPDREDLYDLLGGLYSVLASSGWQNEKLALTARYLTEKLDQRRVKADPNFDIEDYQERQIARIRKNVASINSKLYSAKAIHGVEL